MPMPEDESSYGNLFVMFATTAGDVRRNQLSDFTDVRANGKIAMKLGDDERLVGEAIAGRRDELVLATKSGKRDAAG